MVILENPIRRRIIKQLSQEPSYPLQLAKELGLGQQLIAKHLNIMEAAGVVTSSMKTSPHGPKRRTYFLSKSVSVAIDLAPHMFSAQVSSFGELPEEGHVPEDASSLMRKIDEIRQCPEERSRLSSFETMLNEIDERLEKIEKERSLLLYIRNFAMKEASKMIENMEKNRDTKRVLYYVLEEHSISIEDVSKSLNLREAEVRQILGELKRTLTAI